MRLIDADYLKTWFGEKDLYAYDYIIGTIDDAPTVEPQTRCIAKIEINKEDLENLVEEKVLDIKKAMSNTSNALKPLDKAEERWIPCSERLPKKEERSYWICLDGGGQCQCRWTNDMYGFGSNEYSKWGWHIMDKPQYSKVVAWMPLPEPWKGDKE